MGAGADTLAQFVRAARAQEGELGCHGSGCARVVGSGPALELGREQELRSGQSVGRERKGRPSRVGLLGRIRFLVFSSFLFQTPLKLFEFKSNLNSNPRHSTK